jgi:stage III sporulation protein AF
MAEYIKGIIFFLVFASFVGIILPEGKYKNYINLVMGFVIMALIFRPVSDLSGIAGDISAQLSQPSFESSAGAFEEDFQTMIAGAVRTQMRGQLSPVMDALGFTLTNLDADIDVQSGEIRTVSLTLESSGTDSAAREIRVAPISISPAVSAPNITEASSNDAAEVKKIVSDFYQLPEEHIYVTIQRR